MVGSAPTCCETTREVVGVAVHKGTHDMSHSSIEDEAKK